MGFGLSLTPLSRVSGRVVGAGGGRAVGLVMAVPSDGVRIGGGAARPTPVRGDGSFELPGLAPGPIHAGGAAAGAARRRRTGRQHRDRGRRRRPRQRVDRLAADGRSPRAACETDTGAPPAFRALAGAHQRDGRAALGHADGRRARRAPWPTTTPSSCAASPSRRYLRVTPPAGLVPEGDHARGPRRHRHARWPSTRARRLSGLRVVLTQSASSVSGSVRDDRGDAGARRHRGGLPRRRAKWTYASRFIRTARPDTTGRFQIAALPPSPATACWPCRAWKRARPSTPSSWPASATAPSGSRSTTAKPRRWTCGFASRAGARDSGPRQARRTQAVRSHRRPASPVPLARPSPESRARAARRDPRARTRRPMPRAAASAACDRAAAGSSSLVGAGPHRATLELRRTQVVRPEAADRAAASSDGSRASITCSIAPSRAPDGIAIAGFLDRPLAVVHAAHQIGDGHVAFFGHQELHLAQAGRPSPASSRRLADGVADEVFGAVEREARLARARAARARSRARRSRSSPARTSMAGAPSLGAHAQGRRLERHRHEVEPLVERRADVREQQRELVALGVGGIDQVRDHRRRRAAAAQLLRREERADAEHAADPAVDARR